MLRGPWITLGRVEWSIRIGSLAALLFAIGLISCAKDLKPVAAIKTPPAQLYLSSAQVEAIPTASGRGAHIVLPNDSLIGCKTPDCYQVLPDASSDPGAVYPWQVRLDFNQPAIIGMTALYDQPTTIDEVQAAVDERYGKWAMANFRTGPVRLWRVESEKFAIQLAVNDNGMAQLIYIQFAAKHPTSDRAAARILRDCKEQDGAAYFACAMVKKALASDSAKVAPNPASLRRRAQIVLPNESLIACKTPICYQVLTEASSDASAMYPWQVILDFNQSAVIGLTSLYDHPTTIDDVEAAVNERYGKWAVPEFKGPLWGWRVSPEKFVIQLTTNSDGMVQLIYIEFAAKHPTSDQGSAQVLRDCKERDNSNGFMCAMMKNALSSH
jgi:hypothetical protein